MLGTILVRQYESVVTLNRGCLIRRKRKPCMVDNGRHTFRRYNNNNNNNVSKTTILYWLKPELHKVIFIRALTTDYCHVFSPVIVVVTIGPLQQVKRHAEEQRKHRQDKIAISFSQCVPFSPAWRSCTT